MNGERPRTAMTRPIVTSRRRLLASLGAGTATAVAGCTGIGGGGEPTYEAGEIGDVDGENRTAEEMATAEALAEQEIRGSVTPLDAVSLVEHEFVLEDGYEGATVQGIVENVGEDRLDVVEVRVRAYDDAGDRLGRYLARTGDLESGDRWAFTVILLESPGDLDSYDIAALGTPS